MLLSLQIGFSFVRNEVACAILERTSFLEPSSKTNAQRYLKLLIVVPSFCPFTLISLWIPSLRCLSLVWSSQHRSPSYTLCRFCRDFQLGLLSSCSSSARASTVIGKPQIGNISAAYANLPIMFFQSIRHDPFEKNVEEGGWQKTSLPYSNCCSESFFLCCHSSALHHVALS